MWLIETRLRSITLAALLVAQGLAGCSGGTAAPTPPPATPPTPTTVATTTTAPSSLQGVPFQTLAQGESFIAGFRQPTVLIVTNSGEAEQLASKIHEPDVADQVRTVALDKNVLIAVFLETKGSTGYGVSIQEVVVDQAEVRLTATLSEPGPEQATSDVMASPYHLILLPAEAVQLPDSFTVKVSTSAGTLIAQAAYP